MGFPDARSWPAAMVAPFRSMSRATLIAFLAPALLLYAFFEIAGEMGDGDTHGLDRAVLETLRTPGDPHDPVGPLWLDDAVRDLTSLGSTSVLTLVTLLAVGYLLVNKRLGMALAVAAGVAGGSMLSMLLKSVFERPRPAFIAEGVAIDSWSFPSGHAMLSAITYLTVGALMTRAEPRRAVKRYILGAAIALTLLIGASRVYLGVHYPTDVLAGWCVGAAWALGWRELTGVQSSRAPADED